MATATDTPVPTAKKKRAAFTRTNKPLFAIIKVYDANGTLQNIPASQIRFIVERDAAKILEQVMNGGEVEGAVVRFELPVAAPTAKPAAAA